MSRLAEASNRFYDSIRREDSRRVLEEEASAHGFRHLEGHSYCLVVSYKRSGQGVPTPVWFGVDSDGCLYFRTYAVAAKVNRISNDSRVLIAPCSARGKPLGPAAEGKARVLREDEEPHAEETIQASYGLFRHVYRATGGGAEAVYVEVSPA